MLKKALINIVVIVAMLPNISFGKSLVSDFRTHDKADYSRFVVDVNNSPSHKIFTLNAPDRVVIDIANAKWSGDAVPPAATERIKSVRYDQKSDGTLRIVLDLNQSVSVKGDFVLDPYNNSLYRLVVDLEPKSKEAVKVVPPPVTKLGKVVFAPKPAYKAKRKPLITIDAGHGGRDPGSIGKRGTREKDITLAYALELRRQLLATNRYDVYLTRGKDVYIPLRGRVTKARAANSDLFISIHADSHRDHKVNGLSVYTLSETASDKEAAALAAKENKSGLIHGVEFENTEDDDVSALLIDLVQRDTKNTSASFAETLVKSLDGDINLFRNPHRFAGFRVLTGADIPSVLIELGYLSNKREEKRLKSKKHKKKLAKQFVEAIDNHFRNYKIYYASIY